MIGAVTCSSGSTAPADSATATDDGSNYWPAAAWRTANARDVGMDQSRLDDLSEKISLLVGIAIDQGKIPSVDSKALSFFPEYTDFDNVDQRKENVTLRNLLRMKSGINFYEDPYEGSPLQQLNNSSGDWLRIIFDQPMNAEPGELWQYNSGGVISLGGVIYNAGQWLFIVPRHDIVVAATSNGSGYTGYIDPIDFLYSSILPAVR